MCQVYELSHCDKKFISQANSNLKMIILKFYFPLILNSDYSLLIRSSIICFVFITRNLIFIISSSFSHLGRHMCLDRTLISQYLCISISECNNKNFGTKNIMFISLIYISHLSQILFFVQKNNKNLIKKTTKLN